MFVVYEDACTISQKILHGSHNNAPLVVLQDNKMILYRENIVKFDKGVELVMQIML